jgi:DNA-binding transcriptional ArsR family regulator
MTTTRIDTTFAALADPTRIDIVRRLSRGPASVTELARPSDMSLTGFLKHVRVLEHAGLVRTNKAGRVRRCELRTTELSAAADFFEQVRCMWERRLDKIERYLDEEDR